MSHIDSLKLLQSRGFQVETVIDIGAAEGAFFVVRAQNGVFPAARHFFIDPMQENEQGYRKVAAKFGAGYEIAALSCNEGAIDLRIDPDFYNTHAAGLQPDVDYATLRRVPMRTLDAVVAQHALKPPFAIKLDVQGGELDVLRGALAALGEAVIVVAEIQVFTARDTLVELLSFMQGAGWALFDITDPAYYRSEPLLYQCYTTFIPKAMDFRAGVPWCPPEQKAEVLAGLRQRRAECLAILEEMTR